MSNLRYRTVSVIGDRLNHQRDAAWPISLIRNLIVVHAGFFAGTTTDCSVNRVVGHIAGLGVGDSLAQTSVTVGISSTRAGRNGDLFYELSEKLAALGIERAFFVLNTMPLRMSRHCFRSLERYELCR